MNIQKFNFNQILSNMYAICEGGECILVDVSLPLQELSKSLGKLIFKNNMQETAGIEQNYSQNDLHSTLHSTCIGVVITHCHFDHIWFIKDYIEAGAIFYLTKECWQNLQNSNTNCSKSMANREFYIQIPLENVVFVDNNTKLNLGHSEWNFKITKGHTNCSLTMYNEGNLFCGDLIFDNGYVGRCDLPTGSLADMQKSLDWINSLNSKKVHSGHSESFDLEDFKPYKI